MNSFSGERALPGYLALTFAISWGAILAVG